MRLGSRLAFIPPALLVLPLAGCPSNSSEANATLAELPGLRVGGGMFLHDDGSRELSFGIVYDTKAFAEAHDGACATLDESLHGSFDGKTMSISMYGSPDGEFGGCRQPTLHADLGDAPGGELRLADDSLAIEASFDGRSLGARRLALRTPSAWQMGAGEQVVVELSHPEDLPGAQLETYFFNGSQSGKNYLPIPSPVSASPTVTFQLPSPLPLTGKGKIIVNLGYVFAETLRCNGAVECSAQVKVEYEHAVDLRR